MDDQLVVRTYNVGLGDCIHLIVPDLIERRSAHILIDCGNKFGDIADLQAAIANLEKSLPLLNENEPDGKKRLDLLVVTHRHEDHIKGFDPEWFRNIKIDNIWLSASIDLDHPQAEKSRELHSFAMQALDEMAGQELSGSLADLIADLRALNNEDALIALREKLPQANDIKPLYVHTDTPEADLLSFADPEIKMHILAPMFDIDHYYLGELADELLEFKNHADSVHREAQEDGQDNLQPTNISAADFRNLRQHMHNSALAFVLKEGHLVNNTSVVLLLEWHGHRLLFTGDAQFKTAHKGAFKEGTSNGSWNVMWSIPEIRQHLEKPIDFLKVGHHGSHNATPWVEPEPGKEEHPINEILNALLPRERKEKAKALVSTARTSSYEKIPDRELMAELGHRIANTNRYQEPAVKDYKIPADVDQPLRTDQEKDKKGARVSYLEVKFKSS